MSESIAHPQAELDSLRKQAEILGRENRDLRVAVDLMARLADVSGVGNLVESVRRLVRESVGGGAVSLSYLSGDELWVADEEGSRRHPEEADDPLVRQLQAGGGAPPSAEEVSPSAGERGGERRGRGVWSRALRAGKELVGVISLEGAPEGDGDPLERLVPFFSYAALLMRHEIADYRSIQDACSDLRAATDILVRDMTERRRVDESLRLTQFSVDRALEIILWVDVSGRLIYVNDLAVRLLGYSRKELLGMTIGAVAPSFPDATWNLHWRKIRKQGGLTLESRLRNRDSSEFPVEMAVNSLELEDNRYAIVSARDITRRKQVERQLAAAYEQARTELRAAAEMQRHLLPDPSAICGTGFAWRYLPCRYVAGDIFNYFRLDESRLAFYLIDVAGHGVPAAMLSFTLSTILTPRNGQLRRLVPRAPGYEIVPPAEVVAELNRQFQSGPDVASYFTMTYGLVDLASDHVTLVQAGTPHPLLVSRDGQVRDVGGGGPPVGLLEGMVYEEVRIPFGPGDRLLLCSDGVTECAGRDGDFFPQEFLKQLLYEGGERSLEGLLDLVGEELRRWRGRDDYDDDITILGIERGQDPPPIPPGRS